MRVLLIGANGFIGSAVIVALHRAGIETRCVVRSTGSFARRFPETDTRSLDLTADAARDTECWAVLLEGFDAVINAAGVLQPGKAEDAWTVHCHAPAALFNACEKTGVRRVIHISAIGVMEAETTFARSKRAGDEALMARELDWTILRPAVVVGDGSYGGTSLLRALAVFPFITPLIGDGSTPMDIIHKDDLATGIVELLRTGRGMRTVLEPAGAGRLTLVEVIAAYRSWFGLPPQPVVSIPDWMATLIARTGDMTRMHPITSTALIQFRARLTGDAAAFAEVTGVRSPGLPERLAAHPCESQDLWHARLFLLKPLVRFSLALLWAVSGLVGLLAPATLFEPVLEPLPMQGLHGSAVVIMSTVDLAIALALTLGWRLKIMAWIQIAVILGYTLVPGILAPALWVAPLGGLLKNIPILILLLLHRALEEER